MGADKPVFHLIPAGVAGWPFALRPYIFATGKPLRYISADGIGVC
jgi:hypothetical protein